MPKITFKSHRGEEKIVAADTGMSVMEAAVRNNVRGIDADCGGACACATCHIYIDDAWLQRLGPRTDMEASMLDLAEGVRDNSRLACQIKITPELDGLCVVTPASQH
jgi:2Fe-2S ferredoxin